MSVQHNTNSLVQWDKTGCHDYTVTNLAPFPVTITITSETEPERFDPVTATLQIDEGVQVRLVDNKDGCALDGYYQLCAIGAEGAYETIASTVVGSTAETHMVIDTQVQSARNIESLSIGGVKIYDEVLHGAADFSGLPASANNFFTRMTAAGYPASIFEVGDDPSFTFPFLPSSVASGYLIVFTATIPVASTVQVVTRNIAVLTTHPATERYCTYREGAGAIPVAQDALIGFKFDGVNIMGNPPLESYYQPHTDPVVKAQFVTDLKAYLTNNGHTVVADANGGNVWATLESPLPTTICPPFGGTTYAEINTGPSAPLCTYIAELCNLYACTTKLMRDWLCKEDPCKDPCKAEEVIDKQEARARALELSTLFLHGLMPLVAADKLWWFGDWYAGQQGRVARTIEIVGMYKRINDYTKSCGFNCDCDPCGDPCNPCAGCADNTTPCPNC